MNDYHYDKSSQTRNFPLGQIQIITMSQTSDTIWDIAVPHIYTIIDRLTKYDKYNYNIYFSFKYSFNRPVKYKK
jgi:hypothetical protein